MPALIDNKIVQLLRQIFYIDINLKFRANQFNTIENMVTVNKHITITFNAITKVKIFVFKNLL